MIDGLVRFLKLILAHDQDLFWSLDMDGNKTVIGKTLATLLNLSAESRGSWRDAIEHSDAPGEVVMTRDECIGHWQAGIVAFPSDRALARTEFEAARKLASQAGMDRPERVAIGLCA